MADDKNNPGDWVAGHQLFLQALGQAIRAIHPELMEYARKSLELAIADVSEDSRRSLSIALKLCTDD